MLVVDEMLERLRAERARIALDLAECRAEDASGLIERMTQLDEIIVALAFLLEDR